MKACLAGMLALTLGAASAQPPPVEVHVDASKVLGDYKPIWNYFGADEPNYTYAPGGTQLLGELSAIAPSVPVYFRPHNLLTSGDGSASLKWGSTGVYSEKPDGTPVYDWIITDRLYDNLAARHVLPMVELGFMPQALSPSPEPYRHTFPNVGPNGIYTGWAYPPKDYAKWRALIVAYVTHLQARYPATIAQWKWEVWNEPDIGYFHGTPEEYIKLYDITTGAIRQVLPNAVVGGPGVTGGGANKHFLQLFLEHCARGINADTGRPGAPLDFISYHPKGSPKFVGTGSDGHVVMNLARQLVLADVGMKTIAGFPQYRNTPIIFSEIDPEGCAACQGPQNGYRNGPLYGVSVAEMLARTAELARMRGVTLGGAVTWAFEFEDQPYFAGFRELATDGPEGLLDKPVLNVFRLFGKLAGQLVQLTSTGALQVEDIEAAGVSSAPDIDGIATRQPRSLDILLWNYHDVDLPSPATGVTVSVGGLPATGVRIQAFTVDAEHSNAYTAWLAMGSPKNPAPGQMQQLRAAQGLAPPASVAAENKAGAWTFSAPLARQAVVLYRLSW